MRYLGFLFLYKGVEVVVFVKSGKLEKNLVIGTFEKVVLNEIKMSRFLNTDLELESFPIFQDAKFYYGKISLAKETFIDYEHLTIWFGAEKYKKLKQLFEEYINTEEELVKRVIEIYEYFR